MNIIKKLGFILSIIVIVISIFYGITIAARDADGSKIGTAWTCLILIPSIMGAVTAGLYKSIEKKGWGGF